MIPFQFDLADKELQVKLGNVVLRRIPYSNIEGVDDGYKLWNEHWCNVWPFRYVTVKRKSGLIKNFVINPKDGPAFAEELRGKLEQVEQ